MVDNSDSPADMQASTIIRAADSAATQTDRAAGSSSTVRRMAASFHDSLPGYVLIGAPRGGAQGFVFRAIHTATGRDVAIKVLHGGANARLHDRERFRREINALAQLRHPGIVTIHDGGTAADCEYFVMDYVDGVPLDEFVVQHALGLADVVRLFVRVCDAVSAAHRHERRFVHRDLKSGNIRVTADGMPHVLDFGLARAASDDTTAVTVDGQPVGTFAYMSPEQASGRTDALDPRSDVYALGVVLYKLLTHAFPYDARRDGLIDRICNRPPIPPRTRRADMPRDLETILLRCLQKAPARRYSDAGELRDDLSRWLSNEPVHARRTSRLYQVRKRFTGLVGRFPLQSAMVAAAAITLIAQASSGRLATLPSLHRALIGVAERHVNVANESQPYEHVRVVAIHDFDGLAAAARSVGLNGLTVGDKPSFRSLHGLLMEKLARSGAAAVAWDILFENDSPADPAFVKGLRALHNAGTHVILPVGQWCLDGAGTLRQASSILAEPYVRFGTPTCTTEELPWMVDLAAQRGSGRPALSMAMWMAASVRSPNTEPIVTIQRSPASLTACYVAVARETPILTRFVRQDIHGGVVIETTAADRVNGLKAGDLMAKAAVRLGPASARQGSTIRYEDALTADAASLEKWFKGRAVLIGYVSGADPAPGIDDLPVKVGDEWIAKCFAHAAACESVIANANRTWHGAELPEWLVLGTISLIGLFAGWRFGRWPGCVATVLSGAVLMVGAALALAVYLQYIYVPLPAFVALLLAVGAGWLIRRWHGARAMAPVTGG